MNLAFNYWRHGGVSESTLKSVTTSFTSMSYYRMDPSEKRVRSRLDKTVKNCETGDILHGPDSDPYRQVHKVLLDNGLVKEETIIA